MNEINFLDIQVQLPDLRIRRCDREIHLSLAELKLLMILLSQPGEFFTHDELIDRLQLTTRAGLMQLIRQLRVKLGRHYIVNQIGHGYALARRN